MKKAVLLGLLLPGVAGAQVTLTGSLSSPNPNVLFNGSLTFSIAQEVSISSASGCGGPVLVLPGVKIVVPVVGGQVQGATQLYSSACTQPVGVPYNVTAMDTNGNVLFSDQWLIGAAGSSSFNIGNVVSADNPQTPTSLSTSGGTVYGNVTFLGNVAIPGGVAATVNEQSILNALQFTPANQSLSNVNSAQARTNINAVNRAGDSMNGELTLPDANQSGYQAASAQYVQNQIQSALANVGTGGTGGAISGNYTTQTPGGTINGTNTTFTISGTYASGALELNGLVLNTTQYTINGSTITLKNAPQAGDYLTYFGSTIATGSVGALTPLTPTGTINGTNTVFTISGTANTVLVYLNGLQELASNFTYSSGTITFATAPQSGDLVQYIPTS